MEICDSDRETSKYYTEEEDFSSDNGSDSDYDSGTDPSYTVEEETCSYFKNLSIKKKSSVAKETETDFSEVDGKSYEHVQKIIKEGKIEKLKVDECKVYLRKNGLRLSGNKDILIQRIKGHLEVLNGGGEKKYPLSSFVLNCKGDACTGDVVMFEQNVYEMFNIASRSASGPPCGTRIVAGRIVKESYGAAKQQHTFTIEVLWSKGEKPLPPLHPLLIKGRNLYRLKTMRQRWEDEGERQKNLMEKHSRGSLARSDREVRIQEKKRRKALRENRPLFKEERNNNLSQSNSTRKMEVEPQQPGSFANSGITAAQNGVKLHRGPNFCHKKENRNRIDEKSMMTGRNRFPEVNYHRQLLRSMNKHCHPATFPQREGGSHSQQICQYHAQGRCYYGENCKFLHEAREEEKRSVNHCHPATSPQRQGFHSQRICQYHALGRCYYGENCKFLHGGREVREAGGEVRNMAFQSF